MNLKLPAYSSDICISNSRSGSHSGIGKIAAIAIVVVVTFIGLIIVSVVVVPPTSTSTTQMRTQITSTLTSCEFTPYDYTLNDTRVVTNNTILWSGSEYVFYKIRPGGGLYKGAAFTQSVRVTGAFEAAEPIDFYIMTPQQLNSFASSVESKSYLYSSGTTYVGTFDISLLSGTYYFIFHNSGKAISNVTVTKSIVAVFSPCG